MEKINQMEIRDIIISEIPEVKDEVSKLSSKDNIAGAMQIVVTFTRDMLKGHHLSKVHWCIALIGWVYGRGNEMVRDIIANIFVRSFNGMRNLCSQVEWQIIQEQMPANLYAVYVYQNRTSSR